MNQETLLKFEEYTLISLSSVDGPPVPLRRPRFTRGRYAYDSQKKEKEATAQQITKSTVTPLHQVDLLKLTFFMPIPKSLSKKKQLQLINKPHTKRPDLSNLIKFIEDVASGLLFTDDAIIYAIYAAKFYSLNPKTEIKIYGKI